MHHPTATCAGGRALRVVRAARAPRRIWLTRADRSAICYAVANAQVARQRGEASRRGDSGETRAPRGWHTRLARAVWAACGACGPTAQYAVAHPVRGACTTRLQRVQAVVRRVWTVQSRHHGAIC